MSDNETRDPQKFASPQSIQESFKSPWRDRPQSPAALSQPVYAAGLTESDRKKLASMATALEAIAESSPDDNCERALRRMSEAIDDILTRDYRDAQSAKQGGVVGLGSITLQGQRLIVKAAKLATEAMADLGNFGEDLATMQQLIAEAEAALAGAKEGAT